MRFTKDKVTLWETVARIFRFSCGSYYPTNALHIGVSLVVGATRLFEAAVPRDPSHPIPTTKHVLCILICSLRNWFLYLPRRSIFIITYIDSNASYLFNRRHVPIPTVQSYKKGGICKRKITYVTSRLVFCVNTCRLCIL